MRSQRLGTKSPSKSRPSFIYAILSMSMILLLVGMLGVTVFMTQKSLKEIKENLEFELIMNEKADEVDKVQLRNYLNGKRFVRKVEFISKEAAAERFERELGQNFIELLGFNPLYDAYIINLHSEFTGVDSVQKIESLLLKQTGVEEVSYDKGIVELLNARLKTISFIILGISVFLLVICISLIDSTIRLSMFSQRFLIRSMQLIGATQTFIQKPFLLKAVRNGTAAAGISVAVIVFLLIYFNRRYGSMIQKDDFAILAAIFVGVFGLGIIISVISTFFTVRKYLRMKLDELY